MTLEQKPLDQIAMCDFFMLFDEYEFIDRESVELGRSYFRAFKQYIADQSIIKIRGNFHTFFDGKVVNLIIDNYANVSARFECYDTMQSVADSLVRALYIEKWNDFDNMKEIN